MTSLPEHETIFRVQFHNGQTAQAIRVRPDVAPHTLIQKLGLKTPNPVIFISGGASKMSDEDQRQTQMMIQEIVDFAQSNGASVIDGGTESGIMKMLGDTRDASGGTFPLVGVSPLGRITYPGYQNPRQQAELEDNHSHFVLVDGDEWGDESMTIIRLTYALCGNGSAPAVGLLINGGKIAMQEIYLAATRQGNRQPMPIIVLEGSGRAADEISTAFRTGRTSQRILKAILAGGDIQLVGTVEGPGKLRQKLEQKFKR
jgi:hypothetical protein